MSKKKKTTTEKEETVVDTSLPKPPTPSNFAGAATSQPTEPEKTTEPEEPKKPKKLTLEDQLLHLYNDHPPGRITMQYLTEQTGATELEIGLAWHHLYDSKKLPWSEYAKPG